MGFSKPDLTILTTHFGTNFSGGSTATCEIFQRVQEQFSSITVVGTEIGEHNFDKIDFVPYRSLTQALGLLRSQSHGKHSRQQLYYGDFYNAVLLSFLKQPYYFTYHDNWPELGRLSPTLKLQSLFYWSCYKRIFKTAAHVFTVSDAKAQQVSAYTDKISLVRNGVAQRPQEQGNTSAGCVLRENVLMVGNIDKRKYAKAVKLFEKLPPSPGFQIDLYGHSNDTALIEKLKAFPFVKHCGYCERIPYQRYRLLLHTSAMENLSMVWCEAIMHATPVLSFDVGAAGEVITQSNGTLVAAYDINQMHQDLIRMAHSQSLNSDTMLDPSFSWDKAASAYASILLSPDKGLQGIT